MVCSIWSGKMTALARLVDAGSVSRAATEEVSYQKLAAHSIGRELRDADEANLIDEEECFLFALEVCCNACKKPIKASQYATHAELCKSLISRGEINLVFDGPAVTKKPPRKERKKSQITQSKKAKSLRESKKFESVDSGDIAAPGSHIDENIQMSVFPEARRETHLHSTDKMNGSTVNPYNVDCLKDVTKRSSKPLKRTSAENPSNQGTENFCKSAAEVLPYVPAPLATKIYYSQRNHNLRRAITRMFFEEPDKEFCNEVPSLEDYQVNAALGQTSSPGTFCHEQVARQQRDDKLLLFARTPVHVLSSRSNFYMGESGAFEPSMTSADQLPVNNTLGPHYISNSYSFADKPGNSLGTLQQGSGSVPVV
ncbi:uncharacterized protein LOC130991638 isoform X2 [Salvia miltiorrhiza]|uniref:uncharacterized protein LOC130991638 isoform X2 n=1 Tax=Salvia miltiorrhiza TaxID=226208 RepID=UPI0025AB93CF|nr:uncharacterized protein LOC130991638 isoform X2 [Salvia miltiorrhiza]